MKVYEINAAEVNQILPKGVTTMKFLLKQDVIDLIKRLENESCMIECIGQPLIRSNDVIEEVK